MRRAPRLVSLLLCLAGVLSARDFTALKPQGFVSDFARVVDPPSRAALNRYCAQLEKATGVELALVTIDTLDGEPIEDVANALFRAWGVGKKGKDEGLLLLLAIRDRRHRLEVGYGLEGILPDGYAGSVLREMRPALREGRYGEALTAAARALGSRIAEAKGVRLEAQDLPVRRPAPRRESLPWPLLVGAGVLVLLLLLGGGGSILPWLLMGSVMRRGGGGSGASGGGFGGYDSAGGFGGFGGFGGGDSGGGGASSSW